MELASFLSQFYTNISVTMKNRVLPVALFLIIWRQSLPAHQPIPRLGIYASGSGAAKEVVVLAESELSGDPGVVVLERNNMESILAEHGEALIGNLNAESAVNFGQLLSCDVIAEIRVHRGDMARSLGAASLVAFDALTGARLCDVALSFDGNPALTGAAAVEHLRFAVNKWRQKGIAPYCTISVCGVRGADKPGSPGINPSIIGPLLERRMLNYSNVVVVERARLDIITRETSLSNIQRDALLASYYSLAVDIAGDKEKDKTLYRVSIRNVAGEEIDAVSVSVSTGSIVAHINLICEALRVKIDKKADKTREMDLVSEARLFAMESLHLRRYYRMEESAIAEQTAIALYEAAIEKTPEDYVPRAELANIFVNKAQARLLPSTGRTIGEDILDLLTMILDNAEHVPANQEIFKSREYMFCLTQAKRTGLMNKAEFNPKRFDLLIQRCRQWCLERYKGTDQCPLSGGDIALWANTSSAMLRDAGELFASLPPWLGIELYRSAPRHGGMAHPDPGKIDYQYALKNMPLDEKKYLLELYVKWANMGAMEKRMESCVCAALSIYETPDLAGEDKAYESIYKYLGQAAQLSLQHPGGTKKFIELFVDGENFKINAKVSSRPGAMDAFNDILADIVRALASTCDKQHDATPWLYLFLDVNDSGNAATRGDYLKTAWRQLVSTNYILSARGAEWYKAQIYDASMKRYGGDLAPDEEYRVRHMCDISASRLYSPDSDNTRIESAALHGNKIYAMSTTDSPGAYELTSIEMPSGKTKAMGKIATAWKYRSDSGNGITVGENYVYVPTDSGLICCSIESGVIGAISAGEGLPASNVTACVAVDDYVLLGCRSKQDGFLVRYERGADNVHILAASGRKEKHSMLDDCAPYTIESMVYDKPSRSVLFCANFLAGRIGNRPMPWLWMCNLDKGAIFPLSEPYKIMSQIRLLSEDIYAVRVNEGWFNVGKKTSNDDYEFSVFGVKLAPALGPVRGYLALDAASARNAEFGADLQFGVLLGADLGAYDQYEDAPFSRKGGIVPPRAGGIELLNDKALIASDGRCWQLIPRVDMDFAIQQLPLLDGDAPFYLHKYGENIVAAAKTGVWLLEATGPDGQGDKSAPPDQAGTKQFDAAPRKGTNWKIPDMGMEFVWVEELREWVGKYEVTNAERRRYKPEHDSGAYGDYSLNAERQPAVYVSYEEAREYADWLTGREHANNRLPETCCYRLPTGNEWTAIASCGLKRNYPWGNGVPPEYGNYADESYHSVAPAYLRGGDTSIAECGKYYNDNFVAACPVNMSGENEWGICGLGGNAWEWTADSTFRSLRLARGGSWQSNNDGIDIASCVPLPRGNAGKRADVGFRLVLGVDGGPRANAAGPDIHDAAPAVKIDVFSGYAPLPAWMPFYPLGVNNDVHNTPAGFECDCGDEVVNGEDDKKYNMLILLLSLYPPSDRGDVALCCTDNNAVRIFDNNERAVIGPVCGSEHVIPASSISTNGLCYYIEAIIGGRDVMVELEYLSTNDAMVSCDSVLISTVGMSMVGAYSDIIAWKD